MLRPVKTFPKAGVGLSTFFNMVGLQFFPTEWSEVELSAQKDRTPIELDDATLRRAQFTRDEIVQAIKGKQVTGEVDLLTLDKEKKFRSEDKQEALNMLIYDSSHQAKYYKIDSRYWREIEVDWVNDKMYIRADYLLKPSRKFATSEPKSQHGKTYLSILGKYELRLRAFIHDPLESLERMSTILTTEVDSVLLNKYYTAKMHFRGEIAATVWRILCINGTKNVYLKEILEHIKKYLSLEGFFWKGYSL